jgi:citrate lyase beta subunit
MHEKKGIGVYQGWLFVPINESRFWKKMTQLDADIFVFDLEDAIFHSEKEKARNCLKKIRSLNIESNRIAVRINHLKTKWAYNDLRESVKSGIRHIVYPKVKNAQEINELINMLKEIQKREMEDNDTSFEITPIIETIDGFENVEEIIAALKIISRYVIFGSEDFLSECPMIERSFVHNNIILTYSLARISLICSKYNKYLIDCASPYYNSEVELSNFRKECEFTKKIGAIGKLAIHPKQLTIINNVFGKNRIENKIDELVYEILEIVDIMTSKRKSVLKYKNRLVSIPQIKKYFNQINNYITTCAQDDSNKMDILYNLKEKLKGLIHDG